MCGLVAFEAVSHHHYWPFRHSCNTGSISASGIARQLPLFHGLTCLFARPAPSWTAPQSSGLRIRKSPTQSKETSGWDLIMTEASMRRCGVALWDIFLPWSGPSEALFCVTDWQVDYLTSRQLGGAAVWTLDMDDFSGRFCGRGKYPLVSHLRQKLSQGDTLACIHLNVFDFNKFLLCIKNWSVYWHIGMMIWAFIF